VLSIVLRHHFSSFAPPDRASRARKKREGRNAGEREKKRREESTRHKCTRSDCACLSRRILSPLEWARPGSERERRREEARANHFVNDSTFYPVRERGKEPGRKEGKGGNKAVWRSMKRVLFSSRCLESVESHKSKREAQKRVRGRRGEERRSTFRNRFQREIFFRAKAKKGGGRKRMTQGRKERKGKKSRRL